MENFIVRIYRRDRDNPNRMSGLVEGVEKETVTAFTSSDELLSALVAPPGDDGNSNAQSKQPGKLRNGQPAAITSNQV